jgi:hypothetical protein
VSSPRTTSRAQKARLIGIIQERFGDARESIRTSLRRFI